MRTTRRVESRAWRNVPVFPVFFVRSDPAKSTIDILDTCVLWGSCCEGAQKLSMSTTETPLEQG